MIVSDSASTRITPVEGLNLLKLPPECRRPYDVDNGRKSDRFVEREIEKIPAAIRTSRNPSWVPVAIRDFSQTGFGLHAQGSALTLRPVPGENLELKIEAPWGRSLTISCLARNAPIVPDGQRIGVERLDLEAGESEDTNRFMFDASSRVSVRIANPILYHEWSEAELAGFDGKGVWIFESEDSGLLLFKDAPISLIFDVPMETEDECLGAVAWIRSVGPNRISFGIRWTRLSFQVSNALGEHLLQSESLSPALLSPYGIHLRRFRENLKFSVISTLEEYSKVLDLRRDAYAQAGKIPREISPERLASKYDRESRILGAFHGKDLVATLGLTFPKDDAYQLKSEVLFPGGRYPVKVPPKSTMMEAHTFCTRREYRGGDLVRGIFEQVARCLILSDREWIITLTTAELWPLYRKIGFRRLGASVPVEYFGGLEHHLILLHRNAFVSGNGLTPFAWNYFFGDLVRDLISKGYIELRKRQAMRIKALSLFGGMVKTWSEARLEKEFRLFLERFQPGGKSR